MTELLNRIENRFLCSSCRFKISLKHTNTSCSGSFPTEVFSTRYRMDENNSFSDWTPVLIRSSAGENSNNFGLKIYFYFQTQSKVVISGELFHYQAKMGKYPSLEFS